MKTNYILLILLLSFSLGNAQSTTKAIEIESNNIVSVSENDVVVVVTEKASEEKQNEVIFISEEKLIESIARSSSDIRIYLNKKRKVENIKLLFPKINKAKKA